ncbi:MAG: thiamine diphosphokinase, partial [Candidatus Adiutrix sp.]|nr:thiamine diphosphokinase [Candidatus Adiutrix sp.]
RPGPADLVVGAAGGGRHPLDLGWQVQVLVGDFDSLGDEPLAALAAAGAEIIRHPAAKDEIDFELALDLVRGRGFQNIEVLGALGGRWDMTFGNLFLPARPDLAALKIRFRHGPWTMFVVRGPAALTIEGAPGDLFSLLPWGGDVRGICLSGCLYPLNRETLSAGRSRGLGNELVGTSAGLSFDFGTLVIMRRAAGPGPGGVLTAARN